MHYTFIYTIVYNFEGEEIESESIVMRKLKFFLLLILCFLLIFIFIYKKDSSRIVLKNLPGTLALSTYSTSLEKSFKGIVLITPKTDKYEVLLDNQYCNLQDYDKEKNLFLFRNENSIYIYDISQKLVKSVYTHEDSAFDSIRFIPQSNSISFTTYEYNGKDYMLNLYRINISTLKIDLIIRNVWGNCSWENNGKSVLTTFRDIDKSGNPKYEIYLNDIETGKKALITEGREPEYSNSNKYIAYLKTKNTEQRTVLVVREISTGFEWEYKTNAIRTFRFSPDEKYMIISQQSTEYFSKGSDVVIWDIKALDSMKLIKDSYIRGILWK